MRFSVEEINNSTTLLPNVSLGYDIFDHCSDTGSFPGVFELISVNGLIQPWHKSEGQEIPNTTMSKVIALVGPYTSTHALTVAPLFMVDLIPLVSYGASISDLSKKVNFPSFLRTVHPDKQVIEVIVNIVQHFKWSWVAFLNSDDDFGIDGLELFLNQIQNTQICLAYTKSLNENTNYSQVFKQIEEQMIYVIIVFAPTLTVKQLIGSAIQLNITQKVWIGDDGWSLNTELRQMRGVQNIGTVLGVSQPPVTLPGFTDFIYSSQSQILCENAEQQKLCNQMCNCSTLTPEEIISVDPSFIFAVYSAVYATANALHNVLQCGANKCNTNITVYPYMVLAKLKKSNFTLLNETIQFDENGDPKFGSYLIIVWSDSGTVLEIGHYTPQPSVDFFINDTKIKWYTNDVPTSLCSQECPAGHQKHQIGSQKCCFNCEMCPTDTYINITVDAYTCVSCKDTEWSEEGSTSCSLRTVQYITFTDTGAILLTTGTCAFMGLALAMCLLFANNYNTPVVRSAGGPMCFLILGCLTLCALSVFFYFGKPTTLFCIMRLLPFILFYTVCLACFVVRSFQIVCIFKMAAQFPKLYSLWMKYQGQWLVITGAFVIQGLLLLCGYCYEPPMPYNERFWYPDKIIINCTFNLKTTAGPMALLVSLCSLCFIFSYMGKDLPKNYNEAKAITFCLLLLILTWIIFATVYMLYHDMLIITFNALAVLSSLYSFLLWYFLPKCYIIIFQPHKNTQQYFQGLIQNYTKTISQ
ncbi:taste receptor type 1 member 1 [Betta splendens]|uniref:Taste receptor type 1 member 1 n=1 Tax=Betta splendens TaxID=158456 RepID=A0A6P7N3Y9_BETSP|nr:taste receptor type 1 member 1 [Betta splendens]